MVCVIETEENRVQLRVKRAGQSVVIGPGRWRQSKASETQANVLPDPQLSSLLNDMDLPNSTRHGMFSRKFTLKDNKET